MSTFNLTHPAGFATGQPQKAKHWSDPLDEIEAALQAELNGDNFGNETLRGSSFRRSGLTEVFRRDNVGNPWVCWPSGNSELVDVPGGALRFRLRAPATVMVYFSAVIFRQNKRNISLPDHSKFLGLAARNPILQKCSFHGRFRAYWEGGNKEPGRELIQAKTEVHVQGGVNDRPNMSKGLFLPWSIRPIDGTTPVPLSELRMFEGLAGAPAAGLLQPGWHNIRHTAEWVDKGGDPAMVFGDTSLIVVADYGPKSNSEIEESPIQSNLRAEFG
tara:strand:+ start:16962 stop:17780 length:819 start_codon:yes stop_codon:yes gene_type:complete